MHWGKRDGGKLRMWAGGIIGEICMIELLYQLAIHYMADEWVCRSFSCDHFPVELTGRVYTC